MVNSQPPVSLNIGCSLFPLDPRVTWCVCHQHRAHAANEMSIGELNWLKQQMFHWMGHDPVPNKHRRVKLVERTNSVAT